MFNAPKVIDTGCSTAIGWRRRTCRSAASACRTDWSVSTRPSSGARTARRTCLGKSVALSRWRALSHYDERCARFPPGNTPARTCTGATMTSSARWTPAIRTTCRDGGAFRRASTRPCSGRTVSDSCARPATRACQRQLMDGPFRRPDLLFQARAVLAIRRRSRPHRRPLPTRGRPPLARLSRTGVIVRLGRNFVHFVLYSTRYSLRPAWQMH